MENAAYKIVQNGTVLTPIKFVKDGTILIKGSKILAVGSRIEVHAPDGAESIDAQGNYIVPGFIDIHVHGSKGADVLDSTPEALETMSNFFVTRGVTAYVGTMITAPPEMLLAGLENIRSVLYNGGSSGAELLGAHQEGPFLNPEQKGAHPEELLVLPAPEEYEQYLEYEDVMVIMTLAPERKGAPELIRILREKGIVAALGHSHGITRTLAPGVDAGINHAVHCFCNMSTLRRDKLKRVSGAVENVLYDDRISTELIGDGWHIGDNLMKLAVNIKGIDQVCWVTDAMSAAGMPPGKYFVGDVEAIVEDGIARLPDWSAYASSVTTLDVCVRNGLELVGLNLQDSVTMATLTPASIIGVDDRKGSLEVGKDADIVIVDEKVNVQLTVARGEVVYQAEA